jgi:hypothetical protein
MTVTDSWGHSINGSWTGLTGFLQREEADVGSTGMFLLKERLPVVNFVAAPIPTRYLYRSDTNTFQNLIFLCFRTKKNGMIFHAFRLMIVQIVSFWVAKLRSPVG